MNKCPVCKNEMAVRSDTEEEFCPICHRTKIWEEKHLPKYLELFPDRIAKEVIEHKFPNAQILEKGKGVYFYGPAGTGKTLLACASLLKTAEYLHIHKYGTKALFVEVPSLLQEIKNTYNKDNENTEQKIIEKYQQIPILILDDVAVEKTTDWSYMVLYQIINYRYNNYLTTAFTSNVSLEDLMEAMGDERIPRRIAAMLKDDGVYKLTKYY